MPGFETLPSDDLPFVCAFLCRVRMPGFETLPSDDLPFVCVFLCRVRMPGFENFFLQTSHSNGFSLWCLLGCFRTLVDTEELSLQLSVSLKLSPVHTRLCFAR